MSILAATDVGLPADATTVSAPYRRGDRICATSPEGVSYQVRVDAITAKASGEFVVLGVVIAPRKFRSHVVSTVVGPDGYGPAVRPSR